MLRPTPDVAASGTTNACSRSTTAKCYRCDFALERAGLVTPEPNGHDDRASPLLEEPRAILRARFVCDHRSTKGYALRQVAAQAAGDSRVAVETAIRYAQEDPSTTSSGTRPAVCRLAIALARQGDFALATQHYTDVNLLDLTAAVAKAVGGARARAKSKTA